MQTQNNTDANDIVTISSEVCILGFLLIAILRLTGPKLGVEDIITVCLFTASVFLFKLVFPLRVYGRYFWWRIASLAGCVIFAGLLIHQAEEIQGGLFRFGIVQRRVESLINSSPAYVVTSDYSGRIVTTSANIKDLTGYTQDELIGRPITLLMRPESVKKHLEEYKKAIEHLRGSEIATGWFMDGQQSMAIAHKNGTTTPVKIYVGGVRWSADRQFQRDLFFFAIFVPEGDKMDNLENIRSP